jgi:hypothetical protein
LLLPKLISSKINGKNDGRIKCVNFDPHGSRKETDVDSLAALLKWLRLEAEFFRDK